MASIDTAIETVRYCLKQTQKSSTDWFNCSLAQKSYSMWAAKELLIQLNKNKDVPPLITLENFEQLMDEYSCRNSCSSYLFSCAKDMTRWIIDLLIA